MRNLSADDPSSDSDFQNCLPVTMTLDITRDPESLKNLSALHSEHLQTCRVCQLALKQLQGVRSEHGWYTGKQVLNYRIIRLLGKGAFGEVWQAEDITSNKDVALKRLQQKNRSHEYEMMLLFEIVAHSKTRRHKHILHYIDVLDIGNEAILVIEYAKEGTLKDWLDRNQNKSKDTLYIKEVMNMIDGLLAGIEYLHKSRIMHRDLKPANIAIKSDSKNTQTHKIMGIMDFGLSKGEHNDSSAENQEMLSKFMGTLAYMSPESLSGHYGPEGDLWAAGVIAYEMLCGNRPFPATSFDALIKEITEKPPQPFSRYVPLSVQKVILKSLEKEVHNRYSDATAMRRAFREAIDSVVGAGANAAPSDTGSQKRVSQQLPVNISSDESLATKHRDRSKNRRNPRHSARKSPAPSRLAIFGISAILLSAVLFAVYYSIIKLNKNQQRIIATSHPKISQNDIKINTRDAILQEKEDNLPEPYHTPVNLSLQGDHEAALKAINRIPDQKRKVAALAICSGKIRKISPEISKIRLNDALDRISRIKKAQTEAKRPETFPDILSEILSQIKQYEPETYKIISRMKF